MASGSLTRERVSSTITAVASSTVLCEEATEVETHHQQTAATTMGVAEDETPSSLTSSHPNTNNPNQEGLHKISRLDLVLSCLEFQDKIKTRFLISYQGNTKTKTVKIISLGCTGGLGHPRCVNPTVQCFRKITQWDCDCKYAIANIVMLPYSFLNIRIVIASQKIIYLIHRKFLLALFEICLRQKGRGNLKIQPVCLLENRRTRILVGITSLLEIKLINSDARRGCSSNTHNQRASVLFPALLLIQPENTNLILIQATMLRWFPVYRKSIANNYASSIDFCFLTVKPIRMLIIDMILISLIAFVLAIKSDMVKDNGSVRKIGLQREMEPHFMLVRDVLYVQSQQSSSKSVLTNISTSGTIPKTKTVKIISLVKIIGSQKN
ncbi:hypothetical protein EAG_01368 [Camponotus floridanus]|uniref:Uncharacterized protein n=1 Tax=Camponotus floridanus TaxID=104421 RepID=E2AYW4_CAMFO|nr:hypothetical protein EAG_01368 [Camponotus floridanus]